MTKLPGLAAERSHGAKLFLLSGQTSPTWRDWRASQAPATQRWLDACGFAANENQVVPLPNGDGSLLGAAVGLGDRDPADPFTYIRLPTQLPAVDFSADENLAPEVLHALALGWSLGARGDRRGSSAELVWRRPTGFDEPTAIIEAEVDARNWVETPASDLSPLDLVNLAYREMEALGAETEILQGNELREAGFLGIHHVGRGSARPPALLDATWGPPGAPKITLVGKGVCFDAGGLNAKSHADMVYMRSDMAGAAQALALARLLAKSATPVRLRLLIPAADNMPSGAASMPGDLVRTRIGTAIEIVHTDYEGRLLLADALSAAGDESPELLLDFSTLTDTGLGVAIAGFFTPDDSLSSDLEAASRTQRDPVWRLPLWRGYLDRIASPFADVANRECDGVKIASIAAALFLEPFAKKASSWLHFDFESWNPAASSQRPFGGNVAGLRATYALIQGRYR